MQNNSNLTQETQKSVSTKIIIKDKLRSIYKNHKKLVKAFIALFVVFVVFIIGSVIMSLGSVQSAIMNAMIPNEITNDELGMTFYSEPNPEYDGTKPVLPYICYYYENNDTSGEKIYLQNGVFNNGAEKIYVAAGFMLSSMPAIKTASTVLNWITALIGVAIVVLLIVAWYKSFKKRELAKKEAYFKSHPRH